MIRYVLRGVALGVGFAIARWLTQRIGYLAVAAGSLYLLFS